jgi:hypothetical protein
MDCYGVVSIGYSRGLKSYGHPGWEKVDFASIGADVGEQVVVSKPISL